MCRPPPMGGPADLRLFEDLDGVTVTAPPAGDVDHLLVDHHFLFDAQLASDREMVKGPSPAVRDDVEPGEVAAGGTPIASRRHPRNGNASRYDPDVENATVRALVTAATVGALVNAAGAPGIDPPISYRLRLSTGDPFE